jgi:hypothetical protein
MKVYLKQENYFMTSPFLRKINYIKNGFFFMTFGKKYVPSDGIKLRDEITGFDGTQKMKICQLHSL